MPMQPSAKPYARKGVNVIDRFMPSGHIGHNKFEVLDEDGPQAVLFGSTNWTDTRCARRPTTPLSRGRPGWPRAYRTTGTG